MKLAQKALLTAAAGFALATSAAPGFAAIIVANSSDQQGDLVKGTGEEQNAPLVFGNLDGRTNPEDSISFTGTDTLGGNTIHMTKGIAQAELSGIEITPGGNPNDTKLLDTLNIYKTDGGLFNWIELALIGTGTVTFNLTDDSGVIYGDGIGADDSLFSFTLGTGENKFAFKAIDGQAISKLFFDISGTGGGVEGVRQIRLDPASAPGVPEPATWAMMIAGFGLVGAAMRRRRASIGYSFAR